jgi:hypothetical protein
MNKSTQPRFNPRIRPLEPRDFTSIRSLAGNLPTFTVPSEYLLWFFFHFHPDYCRIIEADDGSLTSYLLAMPTSNPKGGIAIWQVAAALPNRGFALEYFAAYLRDLAERTSATSILFTTTLAPASLRLIRSLAKQFFGCEVSQLDPVPAGQGEYEFQLSLGTSVPR